MQLTNKVALVTGGGTGIGRAVSFALAKRGVAVAVNYSRSKEDAEETAHRIIEEGGRAIVNVGIIAGLTGVGSSLPYAISKSAVHGLTKSLARALAPHIRVNCVAPGAVATRWWAGREEQMQKLAPNLLLKQISTPEDIAQFICAALEQEAMTGQIITVDSGQTL